MARTYYSERLHAFDWPRIVADATAAIDELIAAGSSAEEITHGMATAAWEDGGIASMVYLGRGYRDAPSGSFYAPWSAVPDTMRDADERWWDAFNRAAARYGLGLSAGEGDPTDTYAVLYRDASPDSGTDGAS